MKSKILVEDNMFIVDGKSYDEIKIRKILNKKAEFIILNENISIKVFENIRFVSENSIEEFIDEEYKKQENILTHYEHDRRHGRLYVYSVGSAYKIDEVVNGLEEVQVIPIQFYIKENMKKRLFMKKNYNIIALIKNNIYKMRLKNNYLSSCEIIKESDLSAEILDGIDSKEEIIMDTCLANYFDEKNIEKYNISFAKLGERISEKIF